MVEIAFLKTHMAELSDNEPLAVNLQRYCYPTLEIEEVYGLVHMKLSYGQWFVV